MFWPVFRKILKYKVSLKSVVGAELFHADGRTDMTKLIVALRNFAKTPKIAVMACLKLLPLCLPRENEETTKDDRQ